MEELYSNYATALYGLIDKSKSEEYLALLQGFCSLLSENKEIRIAFSSPSFPKEVKMKMIEDCFKGGALPHLVEFLKVILEHHRISKIDKIAEAFASIVNEANGVKEGIAYSATPLSKKQLLAIEEALEKKIGCKVSLKNKVDENLLGGVKVALDGKVYDGSLRNRLLELQKDLKKPAI